MVVEPKKSGTYLNKAESRKPKKKNPESSLSKTKVRTARISGFRKFPTKSLFVTVHKARDRNSNFAFNASGAKKKFLLFENEKKETFRLLNLKTFDAELFCIKPEQLNIFFSVVSDQFITFRF